MGITRPDNELRRNRFYQLQAAFLSSDTAIADSSKKLTQAIQRLDSSVFLLSTRQGSKSKYDFDLIPDFFIPEFANPDSPPVRGLVFYILKAFTVYKAYDLTYTALRPWVLTAINNYALQPRAANNLFNRIPAGTRILTAWRNYGGYRGIVRQMGAMSAGAFAGMMAGLVIEAVFDEIEYPKLIEAINEGAKLRYVSAYCAKRLKIYEEIFTRAADKADVYVDDNSLAFDLDSFCSKIFSSVNERISNIEKDVLSELSRSDKNVKAYTESDPTQEVLAEALKKYKKNQESLVSGKVESLTISSGWVVDSFQVKKTNDEKTPKWGGSGGNTDKLEIPEGIIKSISWQRGEYQNEPCIFELTVETANESRTFGKPSGHNEVVPRGERIIVNIPSGWRVKDIVCSSEIGNLPTQTEADKLTQTRFVRDLYIIGSPA